MGIHAYGVAWRHKQKQIQNIKYIDANKATSTVNMKQQIQQGNKNNKR